MRRERPQKKNDDEAVKDWCNVGLMPFSSDEIKAFASLQGVPDPQPCWPTFANATPRNTLKDRKI